MKPIGTAMEWQSILQKEYVEQRQSMITIGKNHGCSATPVKKWLDRLGFRIRGTAEALRGLKRPDEFRRSVSKGMKGVNTWMLGRKLSEETKEKCRIASTGKRCTEEAKRKMSENRKGIVFSDAHRKALSDSHIGKSLGPNHWNWQGGAKTANMRLRRAPEYKRWRLLVLERDGFRCVGCGSAGGGILHAHHILQLALYPDKAFDVDNGTTLCKACHSEIHPEMKTLLNPMETVGAAVA